MQTIKQHFNIPLVAGGPHISTMRAQALAECEVIDYGATLEGDETIIELALWKNRRNRSRACSIAQRRMRLPIPEIENLFLILITFRFNMNTLN